MPYTYPSAMPRSDGMWQKEFIGEHVSDAVKRTIRRAVKYSASRLHFGLGLPMPTPGVGCISPNMYSFSRSLGRDVAGPQASISGSRPHNEKPSQRAEICTMIHVFGGVWWRRRRLVPAPAVRSPELVRPPIPFPRRLRPLRTSTAPVRPPPESESWPTAIGSFFHGPEKLPTSPISTNMYVFFETQHHTCSIVSFIPVPLRPQLSGR